MTDDLLGLAKAHLYPNYRPAPFVLTRGEGMHVWDTEGRRYLDMCAGVAVTALGHAHPAFVRAVSEQLTRLGHVSNYFYNDVNVTLAAALCARTGLARAFFCNSGAEANEALLKLARRHHHAKGDATRTRIVAFEASFHGRTMGALALTGQPKYREGFGPGVGGVTHVPYGDLVAVRAAMGPDVAAILAEPVQGEGGVLPAPSGFLAGLRALADEHGALLLLDEVQTGVGRCGTFLGSEVDGVRADAIALAKGLGGGFPIGAMLTTEALAAALPPGTHGSTFGGNPLASAAALAVLRTLDDERLIARAAETGRYLGEKLALLAAELPDKIVEERGRGLLRALVLRGSRDLRALLEALRNRGLLLTVAGATALRFTPPLIAGREHVDEAVTIVREVLREEPSA